MAGADADGDRRNVSDVVGVLVLGACAAWSLITAAAHGGRPEGVLLALLAVAAGYAAGRISGALVPVAAPCAAALAGLGLTMGLPRLAPGPEIVGPLGHAGATAALLTLATGAACCAAWTTGSPVARVLLRLLAVGIAVASAALGSVSGLVTCTAVLLCSLAAGRMRHRGPGIAGLALAATTVTGLTWAVAGDAVPDGLAESLRGRLTPHRIGLWHDALHLARQDTALGVGPGRFGELSTTAAQSLPPDGKPHSAPLQMAAEQGVTGVLLLAAAFCWLLYALWRSPRPTPVVLTAGAALTALAAIAAVGNALSFTMVSVGVGFLAGLTTAHPLADEALHR
ncbi:asparagine N-glycosylation enzyme membrane subunit Stt3 [Streptomyces sp. SAI-135]|uniref:O-antigen ligase family protein n=1 Tax=unclassified Streptomyces TaxID=2593676 RepID=UPI00247389BE|nr:MULTISPECIES: O-antigen ligase family protein [unclassified Streptomyces]MDH6521005.1 asparagine N-glycosylation enzyme membrane subunit Stt3 [Streptomyces sp. SAI-090]MDH6614900.1 asparagine N-glycosylation enzyme membrane subunit Stt3 [Streptomyces sp. SAI-135]